MTGSRQDKTGKWHGEEQTRQVSVREQTSQDRSVIGSRLTDSHCAGFPAVCADAGRGSAPPPGQVRRGEVPDLSGRTGVQVRVTEMSSFN